jgi:hypothetical protein
MLRQLAVYHGKDPNNLFMVRMAQGLTHLGKGTLTLCPYHSDRALMSPVAVAGLLAALVSCLDVKNSAWIFFLTLFLVHKQCYTINCLHVAIVKKEKKRRSEHYIFYITSLARYCKQ